MLDSLWSIVKGIGSEVADQTLGRVFEGISGIMQFIAGYMVSLSAQLLDISIQFSLDSSTYAIPGIQTGWIIFRDVVNMGFIFILLYIAISTILRLSTSQTKRTLINLILVAVFVNFSFLFTAFVIDIGNVTGSIIYNAITDDSQRNIGAILHENLNTSRLVDKLETDNSDVSLSHTQLGFLGLFNSVLLFAASGVFLGVVAIFISRIIVLMFILMLSPLAFAAYILPNTKKHFSKWLGLLINNTFVAPLYLLLLAIILNISNVTELVLLSSSTNEIEAVGGIGADFLVDKAVLLNYILVLGLLIGSHKIAKEMSGSAGAMATKWMGKVGGAGISVGATIGAFAGRNIIGRGARTVRDSTFLQTGAQSTNKFARYASRATMRTSDKLSRSSMDVRGGKFGKVVGATAGAGLGALGIKVKPAKAQKTGGHVKAKEDRMRRKVNKKMAAEKLIKSDLGKLKYTADLDEKTVLSTITGSTAANQEAARRLLNNEGTIPGDQGGENVDKDDIRDILKDILEKEFDDRGL